ncbi:MAG: hypothetical protein MJ204_08865 [Bacteroidales bacterium]|nr:hypothetical protein [Bacteroidales bacterium]
MKKFLLCIVTSVMAMGAVAQQWSGSSTTSGTINRTGTVQLLPETTGVPYSEVSSNHYKVFRYYGTDYTWENVEVAWDGIHFRRSVPAPSSSADIGHGTFSFNNWYSNSSKIFKLTSDGTLTTNGKIVCSDSVNAANIKVTGSISASSANFETKLTTPALTINGTSNPTNFKFGVVGKSYFSDFVGIGTSNLTSTSNFKLAVKGGILCEEVKVIANVPSADYVFEKDYKLHSIEEVAEYVKENKHLPDVPSAKDFKENGYKIGDMDNLLLQKIEELTLYIIEQQKQIKELQSRLSE